MKDLCVLLDSKGHTINMCALQVQFFKFRVVFLENNGQEIGFHPTSKVDNPCKGNAESATDEVQNFGEFKLFEQDAK